MKSWILIFKWQTTESKLHTMTWKWIGLFLRKIHLLICWDWLSLLNSFGALTLSLLLKLPPKKLEPWFSQWSFFLLKLLCISINLPHGHVWNTVVLSELVLQLLLGIVRQTTKMDMQDYWSFTCWLCWTLGSSSKCRQLLSLFYRYYFINVHLN